MDGKKWAYYLQDSADLSDLSDMDLAGLVEQYPYCQSLASLRAKKHLHSSDKVDQEMVKVSLEKAAILTNDRFHLRNFLLNANFGKEVIIEDIKEERKEVTTTKKVEKIARLESLNVKAKNKQKDIAKKAKTDFAELNTPKKSKNKKEKKSSIIEEAKVEEVKKGKDREGKEVKVQKKKKPTKTKSIKKEEADTDNIDNIKKKEKKTKGSQKKNKAFEILPEKETLIDEVYRDLDSGLSGFTRWLKERDQKQDQFQTGKPKKNKQGSGKSTKKRKRKIDKLLAKSTKLDDRSVSETYIELLVKQGYINKAIDLYQRLALKMPEKSSYFAAKIDDLKK